MPNKQFVKDFRKAQEDPKPTGIISIKSGDCDAQFELLFSFTGGEHPPSKIITAVQNVADYPNNHEYLIFCPDDAPTHVGEALQKISGTDKKTVSEFLQIVSNTLSGAGLIGTEDTSSVKDEQHENKNEENEDNDSLASDDDSEGNDDYYIITEYDDSLSSSTAFRERLLADLRLVKEAGFEVTDLGPLIDYYDSYGFVAISIPMSELGIHEDVMNAWHVDPEEHLILIINYPKGYKTYEDLQRYEGQAYDKSNVGMRVVASKNKLPTIHDAISAFAKVKAADQDNMEPVTIREVFISKQLAALLEERLVPILRFRTGGLDWHGAESWLSDLQGANESLDLKTIPDLYYEPEPNNKWFPDIVMADHFTSHYSTDYSFPLLAMQFVLRHFVRCTEFCLTCHRKLSLELEAIKPFFCERPLCLFQSLYLNTGFIEHEIMSQPYVVDLLISFCYSSAFSYKLKEYPDGLALMVPFVQRSASQHDATPLLSAEPAYTVAFDHKSLRVRFMDQPPETCPVAKDSWVVIRTNKVYVDSELHCRIAETESYPTIFVDEPVFIRLRNPLASEEKFAKKQPPGGSSDGPNWITSTLTLYNVDFDHLSPNRKCDTICKLLDTLPTVKEMQSYLAERHPGEIQNWVQRLSPAALRLFRWIVVTNRACIMQVDGDENDGKAKQERLYGMSGYMQFRFAMGAPDKEQRFLNEVRNVTERLNLKYPTLFAWHGSPIYNWHMIIREGLHFKTTVHGRAYGNGVYHAKDVQTSMGYSHGTYSSGFYSSDNYVVSGRNYWPNSVLKIQSAVALSEIVNAPEEFVSSNPYYVVSQLDWIQTRYLLVKCSPDKSVHIGKEVEPSVCHPQDPQRTPSGIGGPIKIPASAVNRGRWAMAPPPKKREEADESSTEPKKFKATTSKCLQIS